MTPLPQNVVETLLENTRATLESCEERHRKMEIRIHRLRAAVRALERQTAGSGGNPKQNIERIAAFLRERPGQAFRPSEIAVALQMRRSTVHTILTTNTELFTKAEPESKDWGLRPEVAA